MKNNNNEHDGKAKCYPGFVTGGSNMLFFPLTININTSERERERFELGSLQQLQAVLYCSIPHNINLVYINSSNLMVAPPFKEVNHPTGMARVNCTSLELILLQNKEKKSEEEVVTKLVPLLYFQNAKSNASFH